MSVRDHLLAGEMLVADHDPFYLTSARLLYCRQGPGGEVFHSLYLSRVTGVEEVRATNHRVMVIGTAMAVAGVLLWATWGLYTSWLVVVAGVAAMGFGAMGRAAGYQVRAHNLPKGEEAVWRLPAWGSSHFVGRVREMTGGGGAGR